MSGSSCPFCAPDAGRIFHAGPLTLGLWDGFPVSPGHALLVPKRHVASWFEATEREQAELLAGIEVARRQIETSHEPQGYNIGVNVGQAAGQTVLHLHVHLIPRYERDVADPRGGVRHVLPAKANYLSSPAPPGWVAADREAVPLSPVLPDADLPHAGALIAGGDDPLLPHVVAHLAMASAADFAVAFVLESGMRLLGEHLADFLAGGGRLRFLTGDYLGVTEPTALLRLMDLREEHPERVELRVFETARGTFHPKSYLFRNSSGTGVALVGSSNLTRPALLGGVEWNYRTVTSRDQAGFEDVVAGFEALFTHPKTRRLDSDWVDEYRERRPEKRSVPEREISPPDEVPEPPPEPHSIQQCALQSLAETRDAGNTAGLVVLATGLGKTWLSAFDSARPEFQRVLFVAHREEILRQALGTFRRIRPEAKLGLYTGQEKTPDADVVFASIQTLSRKAHLERFAPEEFDYVIVDEFHHAAARTYRQVIDYFEPGFLLGLTATPERTDGGDLLALCQENLVFRCDLAEGIGEGLLSAFHYYGVPDEVDYANIPWRSSRFDEEELTKAVATQSRARNALEQHQERGGERTLAFCCSTRHADFMRDFFREAGVRAAAVHSERSSDPRARTLERLESGDLDVVFAVDMFNEGVDIPRVDTVMMLRPTESRVLWLQQFGRGLRKAEGKDHLRVIDYIGNHRTFLLKPQTLFDLAPGDAAIGEVLNLVQRGEAELPPGCEVTYELEAVDILRSLLRQGSDAELVRFYYQDFRDRTGSRPTATEMHHEGYRPRSLRKGYDSWFGFVQAMGDFGDPEEALVREGRPAEFLASLETTPMTRSFKMLVLLAILNADSFPGEISIENLCGGVRRIARRSAVLQRDLSVPLDDDAALRAHLEKNPIEAWTGGKGTSGSPFFAYSGGRFSTTFDVPAERREAFAELARELADWRLAEYLGRSGVAQPDDGSRFVCQVSHANGKPILFLPPREKHPNIPDGWSRVMANDEALEANFVKVAVNVVRRAGSDENVLAEILRGWFGENAGQPGTGFQVTFQESDGELDMTPVERGSGAGSLAVGRSYMREEVPKAFGLDFKRTVWEQGFVWQSGQIFLLVTLEKKGKRQEHRYPDRFLSPDRFAWTSQNRHARAGKPGQAMKNHAEREIPVHLLVRKQGKIGGKAAPFIYCGEVDFVSWEGEKPITVEWRLRDRLSDALVDLFRVEP